MSFTSSLASPDSSSAIRLRLVLLAGILGCLIAGMSVVDMFLPKAYDGVVPDPYGSGGITVRDLVPGGAGEKAGLRPGDVILGIGHRMLKSPIDAPPELRRHKVGEAVDYLVRRGERVREIPVVLTSYRVGSLSYFYYALLGAVFFALGVFVVSRRPDDPAVQVFYLLCILFMLFFVCRLRPSSYYWIDYFVQVAGTLALFLLPAVFLHFFLLFPTRKVFHFADQIPGGPATPRPFVRLQKFLNGSPLLFTILYTLPPTFYVLQMAGVRQGDTHTQLMFGAPRANWMLLADYLILGVLALAHSWWTSEVQATRRQILFLLIGTLAGTIPFVLFAVFFPSFLRTDRFLAWGVVPMALVPLTFAYAIVRFRLFDVQVIFRKSIVYAILTTFVTGIYALAVVAGNALFSAPTSIFSSSSPFFAFVFGLVVVLLFDPLRRRMQNVVDRIFFRDRADFQQALLEMSRSVVSQLERSKIEELLTSKTAELLRLERLVLLTPRAEDGALSKHTADRAGALDVHLPVGSLLARLMIERNGPIRLSDLDVWSLDEPSRRFREAQLRDGIRALVPVATRGKLLGLLAVGAKRSEEELNREDFDHLATIANQGALGLEAASLHEELTRRAEMERDLEIARDIQRSLFPRELPHIEGVEFFGVSLPARVVGGDFYDFLEVDGSGAGRLGLVLGDVSGKSIPASLLMVAAKEIVYARAMHDPDPATVFRESNKRVYDIKRKMFVALSYFLFDPRSLSLHYAVGGQPMPLLLREGADEAVDLPAPRARLPLGALRDVVYDAPTFFLRRGDLLLFYTDGLNEAMSTEMSVYGDERLKASLARHAGQPLSVIADELMEDIRQFTFGAEQYDDQTFVLMRLTGKPSAAARV
ncbi:MAG: SpoIIE family protein phosphatase [Thermoanaerobaculia bacterium]